MSVDKQRPTVNKGVAPDALIGPETTDEHVDPNDIGTDNQYAGFVAPDRADQSLTAGRAGDYYPGAEVGRPGNVVTPSEINQTHNITLDDNATKSKPLGNPGTSGYGPY